MKRISLVSGVVLVLAFLIWIIPVSSTEQTTTNQTLKSPDKKEITILRFGHNSPVDSALHQAALRFANEIEEKTNSQIKIEIYPLQALGNDQQMIEMARNGDIDIILTPTAKMSVAVPSMQYVDLPFFFPTREDVYEMLDGEPGQMLFDDLRDIGLIGVTFWENGFKHFTGNQPFLSPDDFKGKKIRVMKSRIIMEQFESFGAEAVAIDFLATKKALADKVVDGQENPLAAIVGMGFYEVQSNLTLSEHAYLGYVLSISEKTFKKLPQNIELMLIDTAKKITPWEREETKRREQKLIEIIEKSGVKIDKLSEENRNKFVQKTSHIVRKFEDVIGADIISKTQALFLEKYGPNPKDKKQMVIAIDADLSMDGKVVGLAIKRGVELAINEINNQGGVLGKKLVLLAKDHRAISSIGIKNIKEFASRDDVVAIIGGLHSSIIVDEIDVIQNAHIPYLVPWAAAAEIIENGYKDNYIFRASANDRLVSEYITKFALKKHKKPAIIVENSIWGRSNLKRMKTYLNEHGINNLTTIIFNRGQKDFKKELKQISDSDSDSVIMVANSNEGSLIVQEAVKQKKVLPIFSHWGILGGTFFEDNKRILKSIDLYFFQTFKFCKQNTIHCKKLLQDYLSTYSYKHKDEIKAASGVAQAHDLIHLLVMAIEKAKSTERKKVKEALEDLPSYDGITKSYKRAFSSEKHEALDESDFFMAKFSSDGKIIAVDD